MIDLRNLTVLPAQAHIDVGGANIVQEIRIDTRIRFLAFRPIGSSAKVSFDQSLIDGEALADKEYSTLSGDVWTTIRTQRNRSTGVSTLGSYFLTSATPGIRIEIEAETSSEQSE